MGSFKAWWRRRRSSDWPLEREVAEELRFHLASRVDDNLAAGMSEHDAQRDAERRLGDFDAVVGEGVRVRSGGPGRPPLKPPFLDGLMADLQYGVRLLRAKVGPCRVSELAEPGPAFRRDGGHYHEYPRFQHRNEHGGVETFNLCRLPSCHFWAPMCRSAASSYPRRTSVGHSRWRYWATDSGSANSVEIPACWALRFG